MWGLFFCALLFLCYLLFLSCLLLCRGTTPADTTFSDPFIHQALEGAVSCCFSLDATSYGALGFPFSWKRLVWDEHRQGAILPFEILRSVN